MAVQMPRIDPAWCKGCGLCIAECPRGVLDWSEQRNAKGHRLPVVLVADDCTACRLCEFICPDFALWLPEEE